MRNTILTLLTICLTFSVVAQKIQDAPFVYSKATYYSPIMSNLNFPGIINEIQQAENKSFYQGKMPIYPTSYLFAEPEYDRVRVTKTIDLSTNQHFTVDEPCYWVKKGGGSFETYDSKENLKQKRIKKSYTFNTHFDYNIRKFIGVDVKSILNDTNSYRRGQFMLKELETELNAYEKEGYVKFDDGVLLKGNQPYIPNAFEVISFEEVLLRAILKKKKVTAYADASFTFPLTTVETYQKLDNKNINAIRIKEDYFVDVFTGKFTSRVMGIGLVGEDKTIGNELVWLYYPELSYALMNACAVYEKALTNYDYLIDQHLYDAIIDSYEGLSDNYLAKQKNDFEFMVKLFPQLIVQLYQERNEYKKVALEDHMEYQRVGGLPAAHIDYKDGVAYGTIKVFHENGHLDFSGTLKNGICEGEFLFYYPDQKLKALRKYEDGVLHGTQNNYYHDGVTYANYEVDRGMMLELKRNYPNGHLLEEGLFKNGIPFGRWNHRIEGDQRLLDIIKGMRFGGLITNSGDGFIEVSLNYLRLEKPDAPVNYYQNKVELVQIVPSK